MRGTILLLSSQFKQVLFNQRRSLIFLWLALFALAVIFPSLRDTLLQHLPPARKNYPYAEFIRILIWMVALLTAGFLVWSKNRFYSAETIFQGSKVLGPAKTLKGESPMEKGTARVVSYYRTRMVRAFVLAETPAVYGLLLDLTGDYSWDQRLLSALSAALLIFFYPSRLFFEELLEKCERREIET